MNKTFSKIIALLLSVLLLLSVTSFAAAESNNERIKLTVLTTRNNAATSDVTELWWFKYLGEKFNVDFELTQTMSTSETVGLMFSTGDMYDIVYGISLSPTQAVQYGDGEGMIVDWTPYITAEKMPYTYQCMQDNPDAFAACCTTSGKMYGLPSVYQRGEYAASGSLTAAMRTFINQDDLAACNLTVPTTLDEFLNMLRVFKQTDPNGVGDSYVPFLATGVYDRGYFWSSFGYIGANSALNNWGTLPAIKNGEVYLPCYTEDYKAFVQFYRTMYEEKLMSEDYFDTSVNTNAWRSLISQGLCSVMSDATTTRLAKEDDPEYYSKWISVEPIKANEDVNVYASLNPNYQANVAYASSSCKYLDRVAEIMDFCFSPEGYMLYSYGPRKGSDDCMGVTEGWYFDESGVITNDETANGAYASFGDWINQYVRPTLYGPGDATNSLKCACELAGQPYMEKTLTKTDALTGQTYTVVDANKYPDGTTVDACWRYMLTDAWKDNLTTVTLPDLYLTPDEMATLTDLSTVIVPYVNTETASFIVGSRDMSTIDSFIEELKAMGIEELLELYRKGYASYLSTIQ